ncbi:MAG: TetR/AcrR family transcriptional regulator [Acidimicrobiaceae bacterium]|nr:TetR/AcrR family transcriptional regulator [Acidimicrobiaceae bacterium]MXW74591.1 TetR/AcrR family transcriptional regulator [Acidimicrobiaceae bacterium]MYA73379.1 TetR/AcrR family transcriptional regulator [Acidimicrobiaceae bacterium]MYC43546.1 TetR/AcrR family transcriptional regulator [Acidimicrobiaceae bacterium]MYD05430.1 TetR/AcrR family transcriptional regulator [Acidimicrobiaceae bacterium]
MSVETNRTALSDEAIVAEALAVVRESGIEALSMRTLGARMGVTAPAFYAYFESRDELLRACAQVCYDDLAARFSNMPARSTIEMLRQSSLVYVQMSIDEPQLFQLMFRYRPDSLGIDIGSEHSGASAVFNSMVDQIRRAIADGDLAAAEPLDYAMALWAAVHGVATVARMAPGLDAKSLVERVVDGLIAGWSPRTS